ncbi:hypothetical protein LZ318_00225, partial [Saccharopolyspora indica]|uniref:hypothetical protein n=1 Tax=Saccharopolyspora indica TaxID=1229659 RepID=UPI002FE5CE71
MFHLLELPLYMGFAASQYQERSLPLCMVNRCTDSIGQHIGRFFAHEPAYENKQGFVYIQTETPAQHLFVLLFTGFDGPNTKVMFQVFIRCRIPYIMVNTIEYTGA